MAEAGNDFTGWVWLGEAYQRACEAERSKELAARHLRKAILDRQLELHIGLLIVGGHFTIQRELPNEYFSCWDVRIVDFKWAEDAAEGWLTEQGDDGTVKKHRFFAYRIRANLAELQRLYPDADKVPPSQPQAQGKNAVSPERAAEAGLTLQEAKVWFDAARKRLPRRRRERQIDYARRLHEEMQNAPVRKAWSLPTLSRRLYDK